MFIVPEVTATLEKSLREQLTEYLNKDDVFQAEFLQTVLIYCNNASPPGDLDSLWQEWGTKWHLILQDHLFHKSMRPGPYLVRNGCLYEAWRLYDDYNKVFLSAMWYSQDDMKCASLCMGNAMMHC